MTTYEQAKEILDEAARELAEKYLLNVQTVTVILIKGYNMGLDVAKEVIGELK